MKPWVMLPLLMPTMAEGMTFSPGERKQSEKHYKPEKAQ